VGGYGEDLAAIHAEGFTAMARDAAHELLGRLRRPWRVVDLGCGDGTTARLLTDAGHDVLGIDRSPELVAIARRRAPRAEFRVGSFVDAELPAGCDAILAVGEVLGYALDPRVGTGTLGEVVARCARSLRRGGALLFDLAAPGRVPAGGTRGWTEGPGWTVLVDARADDRVLTRRIVTFREVRDGRIRRAEEVHRLVLHRPADVLAVLRTHGLAARTLRHGYAGRGLPPGLVAYAARRR